MERAIFYIAFGLLLYCYLFYPVLLLILPAGRRSVQPDRRAASAKPVQWPFISVLVTAYNEQAVIADKIRNFLACGYPGPGEMVLVSDGSTDDTVRITSEFACDRVRVFAHRDRRGKTAAINETFERTRGKIVVFSDANAFFAPGALTELVRPFTDPAIGLVTGVTDYLGGPIGSAYQRYEQMLKQLEARSGTIATADGAIYAMRRELWQKHDQTLIQDFLHPILVTLQGAKATIAPGAVCFEQFSLGNEFRRQIRMVSCAAAVYMRFLPRLIKTRRWRSLLVLTSHKMFRWLTAPLLALIILATVRLAPAGGVYRFALMGEALFCALALVGRLAENLGLGERMSFVYQFVVLNCAAALGLYRCIAGRIPVVWRPRLG
jgi:cellulose synthase/poly-beta-1,6-N-acetylglucosamine synthase-like glycosyltransferase